MKGIIDILWEEVKQNWNEKNGHLEGNEAAQAWEEYQIGLTEKAYTEGDE